MHWINRVGGKYDEDGDYHDVLALTIADTAAIQDGLLHPLLRGIVRLNHSGAPRIAEITHNPAHISADAAVTILLKIHDRVEGCDDGEVAALHVKLMDFLSALFEDEIAQDIARRLDRLASIR